MLTVGGGGDATSIKAIVAKISDLETRQTEIVRDMATLRPVPRLAPAVTETRLAEWRRLLRQSTTTARTVLQRVLRGRLTCTPRRNDINGDLVVEGYDFTCPTRFDKLFTGIAVEPPTSLDPDDRYGTEDIGPEDGCDGDYGRLLEPYAKGVASLLPGSWNQITTWLRATDELRRAA